MSKLCIFLAEGFEEIEALTVVDLCKRAAIDISMVSITKDLTVTGSHQIPVTCDCILDEVDFNQADMIILPGGMPGTRNLEACEKLMAEVDAFHAQKKYLSAICAAPSIFGHKGILKGQTACCYPTFESHLEGATVSANPVETSEHFITSRGMGTAIEFGLAIIARIKDQATSDEIAKSIIYK